MPRLRRRRKQRSTIRLEDLLIDEMLDLAGSWPWKPPSPSYPAALRTLEDVEDFYQQYLYRFKVCYGRPCDEDHHELFCCRPGTRPWVWWHFQQDQDVPECQGYHLLQLGELDKEERGTAIRMARAQAEAQNDLRPPEELDEFLLWVWPMHLRLFNEKAEAAPWIRERHQRALTAEDLSDMAVDAVTAYATVHVARRAKHEQQAPDEAPKSEDGS